MQRHGRLKFADCFVQQGSEIEDQLQVGVVV